MYTICTYTYVHYMCIYRYIKCIRVSKSLSISITPPFHFPGPCKVEVQLVIIGGAPMPRLTTCHLLFCCHEKTWRKKTRQTETKTETPEKFHKDFDPKYVLRIKDFPYIPMTWWWDVFEWSSWLRPSSGEFVRANWVVGSLSVSPWKSVYWITTIVLTWYLCPKANLLCVVSTVVSFDEHQRFHRLATVPQRQNFQFRGSLPSGMASHSLLLVRVRKCGKCSNFAANIRIDLPISSWMHVAEQQRVDWILRWNGCTWSGCSSSTIYPEGSSWTPAKFVKNCMQQTAVQSSSPVI